MNDKDRDAIKNIHKYCQKIEGAQARYFPNRKAFDEEEFYRDGCAFYVQQIGEWVGDLSNDFIRSHPQIEWHSIRGTRNIIAHAYGKIDSNMMWEIITNDIEALKSMCAQILSDG